MRLGITSDCIHYRLEDGRVVTSNHILKRQIDALAEYFEHVIICCPFIDMPADTSYSVYENKKIHFIPSPNVGGDAINDKIRLIKTIPIWIKLFKIVDKNSDIVYQRFPNNLNIPGFFYFFLKKKKVFATFTGSWDKDPVSSFSTRFQRFLLKYFFRGPVWVYTNFRNHPKNIIPGFSPSYTLNEWKEEVIYIEKRKSKLLLNGSKKLKMISVGTLCVRKNHSFILNSCLYLKKENIPFSLAIVGVGEKMEEYKKFIEVNELSDFVELKGSLHYSKLRLLYRENDFVVQSPTSEPYGKVPIEGYLHGLIPILSSSSILANHITNNNSRGFTFDLNDEKSLFHALKYCYYELPEKRKIEMIEDGRAFVKSLTIDEWATGYIKEIGSYYSISHRMPKPC
jgi:glycosyltransferase involved in cell wall biosynthesis